MMIKKLRKNFIIVAMCSTLAVLVLIIGILNLANYRNVVKKADSILDMLAENEAVFPEDAFGGPHGMPAGKEPFGVPPDIPGFFRETDRDGMSPETPYETRFFSARMDETGEIVSVDTGRVAALETEEAVACVKDILKKGRERGFYEHYRYRVVQTLDGGRMVICVDRNRELSAYRTLAITSVSVSVLGFLMVFILVTILSNRVFAPIADSYEKQKRFITDAGHELKTPLTIISADVEILELEKEDQYTRSIHHQIDRLSELVSQLVALSRMDEGGNNTEFLDFSLTDAVQETVEPFKAIAETQGKCLKVETEELCTYHGDERLIRQMISLLLDNAMKYSAPEGEIRVDLARKGKKYQLRVRNTVEEMEKGNHDILFERFYRADASRNSETGGSGIGLSIVKSIVELHKGKITATSEDGKSIIFTAVL